MQKKIFAARVADEAFDNPDALPLEIKGLYKKYGEKSEYAVADISFACEKGEIVGLLGANGAGKSTTLKCLTGMIPITAGEIRIAGIDIEKNPVAAKTNFSFVTDNHAVFTKMTGLQYLKFMADIYKVPDADREERINRLEQTFRLGDAVKKLISSYSHGMKQKICMMGSLMHEPPLWILDEPMVGLDPRTQAAVVAFMGEYVKAGRTILFSSHNLDVVRRICDRIIIIKDGVKKDEITLNEENRGDNSLLEQYYLE